MVRKYKKRIMAILLIIALFFGNTHVEAYTATNGQKESFQNETTEKIGNDGNAEEENVLEVSSPSAILMEASTGQIIYEKNSEEIRSPASITKIMTLLLTFEALKKGKIKLEDEVITSAHAKSMGGSQVFLEEGEIQTVDTLIKCIVVASGNDAAVAIAEHIAGSEEEFVNQMNQKAKDLHMEQTKFVDCCGLSDSDDHVTSARDVAIMSRELINHYPEIYDYTKIWMEDITHNTKKGSSQFTLSSTNKLIRQYKYATGLKTGSTSKAKYCLSATANKDGIDLIAVVMAAPDYKFRFQDAIKMLNYGFSVCRLYKDQNKNALKPVLVENGVKDMGNVAYKSEFVYLDVTGANLDQIKKEEVYNEKIEAPVKKGDQAGYAIYKLDGKEIGKTEIIFTEDIHKAYLKDYLKKVAIKFLL